ncbi:hypothetical protein V6615_04560 [Oscillospiraceae bacterium PP1C4]
MLLATPSETRQLLVWKFAVYLHQKNSNMTYRCHIAVLYLVRGERHTNLLLDKKIITAEDLAEHFTGRLFKENSVNNNQTKAFWPILKCRITNGSINIS